MEQQIFKRCIDVVCALILLVLASPFMLITAIVIKLYDGGPVLYKQIRCTRDAKEFKILKFRSMRVDAEKDGVASLPPKMIPASHRWGNSSVRSGLTSSRSLSIS